MVDQTPVLGFASDFAPEPVVQSPDNTLLKLPAAVKRRLASFLRRRETWAAQPKGQPPPDVGPPRSPKALYPGCEFCPSVGGGCIVCADWD